MIDMNLPQDLAEFLRAVKQLHYDPNTCEAGAIKLLGIDQIKVELFPMYIDDEKMAASDPHYGENGYYLVEGVNLVAECTAYDPVGLLLWLPLERCYATWDMDHWYIGVFSQEMTWWQLVQNPAQYINAQWVGAFEDSAPANALVPWPKYRYSPQMPQRKPFPYTDR
jgi:hypothetical protein